MPIGSAASTLITPMDSTHEGDIYNIYIYIYIIFSYILCGRLALLLNVSPAKEKLMGHSSGPSTVLAVCYDVCEIA